MTNALKSLLRRGGPNIPKAQCNRGEIETCERDFETTPPSDSVKTWIFVEEVDVCSLDEDQVIVALVDKTKKAKKRVKNKRKKRAFLRPMHLEELGDPLRVM